MTSSNIVSKGEGHSAEAESLNTEERVLEYLRAAMLESGDDPRVMAIAIRNVEAARARLRRKDPLRATRGLAEPKSPAAKQSS